MKFLVDTLNDANSFDQQKAGELIAYVTQVKSGGPESCNCSAKHVIDHDTHIELVMDPNNPTPDQIIIVEVTPRIRAALLKQGIDWSTKSLKKHYLNKKVRVQGWLFFDAEHLTQSFANDPDDSLGKPNLRASCWELHPVTSIELEK